MSDLPFKGIRVLQFGSNASAPAAGRYFAQYGAEVIRIESNLKMDKMRFMMPITDVPPEEVLNSSLVFNNNNLSAKGIQANLQKPETVELLKKLVKISDVVIENYSRGFMKRIGMSYDDLKEINPGIIMLSLSAVGDTGPHKGLVTYGASVVSITGMQSMLGYSDGEPAIDISMTPDHVAPTLGVFYVTLALHQRRFTGKGQFIDMGQASPVMYAQGEPLMDYSMNNRVAKRQGNWRVGFCPHNVYPCKPNSLEKSLPPQTREQWISICVETEEEWTSLCDIMGNPGWTKEKRFSNYESRWQNQEELDKLISEWTKNYSDVELERWLQEVGVAAIALPNVPEMEFHPQLKARDVFTVIDYTAAKDVIARNDGLVISGIKPVIKRGPNLGEHNDYVYGELLGLSKEEIEQLKEEDIIK